MTCGAARALNVALKPTQVRKSFCSLPIFVEYADYSTASVAAMGVNPTQEAARVLSGKWPNGAINRTTVKPRFPLV